MAEEKKKSEEASFTVRDRRMFTAEGELRDEYRQPTSAGTAPAPDTPPAPAAGRAGAEATAADQASETARREFAREGPQDYKPDFTALVASLATTAMYQLGLVRDEGGIAPPMDLDAARHTIDMLGVIEEKTRGNLSPEEKRLLDQSLYDLRMSFLAIRKALQEKGKKP